VNGRTVVLEDVARDGSAHARMHRGKIEGMQRLLGRATSAPLATSLRRRRAEQRADRRIELSFDAIWSAGKRREGRTHLALH